MLRRKILSAFVQPWVLTLILAELVLGQLPVGSIEGTVRDPSGAVLEGVAITVTEDTGSPRFRAPDK